jgi:hypothetical protein
VVRALSVSCPAMSPLRSASSLLCCCALLSALLLGLGCDSLSEFKGTFSGSVVEGSFVRSCFSAGTSAELTFNPGYAAGSVAEVPENERNWLTLRSEQGDVVFDAPLDPVEALSSDTLADFDFPGQKRLRNFMLMARSSEGPLAGRDALVVVSLLATKKVELRVIARGGDGEPHCSDEASPDAGASSEHPPEYYGLFKLK